MKVRKSDLALCALLLGATALLAACGSSSSDPQSDRLAEAQFRVQGALDSHAVALADASDRIRDVSMEDPQAREIVSSMCAPRPGLIDCLAIDPQGILRIVEPESYRRVEGMSVSDQPQFQHAIQSGEASLSALLQTVEGVAATIFQFPVRGADGQIKLSLSSLISPADLCREEIEPVLTGSEFESWVMDTSGVVLYDRDASQIGINVLTDPRFQKYPSLRELVARIVAEPEGEGEYSYLIDGTDQLVHKQAQWKTVSVFGTAWRVMVYKVI